MNEDEELIELTENQDKGIDLSGRKKMNSMESFKKSNDYQKAIYSENADEFCKNCSCLFIFEDKTRCYAYEQQLCNDKGIIFHPRRDYNCKLFTENDIFSREIEYYVKALKNGIDPKNDAEYCNVLKEANDYSDLLTEEENRNRKSKKSVDDEWDDPNTYAHCSDWEDEPDNCMLCADDDCPLNKG